MGKFSSFVVIHRKLILAVVAALLVLSVAGTVFLILNDKINSDMLVYLPQGTSTGDGIKFLKEKFGVEGDAFVVVEGTENDVELSKSVNKMKQNIDGITTFLWYGDVATIELFAKIAHIDGIDTEEVKSYLRRPIYDAENNIISYNYVLLVLFDFSPSTQAAFNVHAQIRAELRDNLGRSVAISGMTALADTVMTETMKEVPLYLIFSLIVVLIILFLSTGSYLEPLVLLITMGVAVVINMGSNYLLPEVSIISFAASSVLQLGITMDYAIFLLHTYREERLRFNPYVAAKRALPRTIVNIFASALTTVGGFAALYFMRFTIGADLANVIIKGVVLSLITVIILQPCLMVVFDGAILKTSHKMLKISFEPVAKGTLKARVIIVIIAVLLIVPAFIGQNNVKMSYLKIYKEPTEQTAQEKLASELQNQVIVAVPVCPKEGRQREFMAELMKNEKIASVLGAYSIIDMPEDKLISLLNSPVFADNPLVNTFFAECGTPENSMRYTLYLIGIDGDTEDEAAFECHRHLTATLNKYFDNSYPLGVLTGVADMAKVTPTDFLRVSLISAGIILLVMCIMLKSVRKSLLMVLLIELAIWVNISISTILGMKVNFMIYIIISSIQLGCTVDYAILLNSRFEEAKLKFSDSKTAAIKAAGAAFPAITTSASIIMAVCLAIYFVSRNLLVKEMAYLMTRGAFISYILVIFVLPCVLSFFKKSGAKGKFLRKKERVTEAPQAQGGENA